MQERERERGWWTRREEEKTANGQHQRGGGATPKATATPVLALGVCVASVASVCGRRGDQWQPPLWHSGCCGVCDGVEWWWWEWQGVPNKQHAMVCVVVDVACVVAGKASGWRGVAATQCPHAHHQPPPWRPPPVPVCVCGTRGVVVVTTTPKQPGKRHACACAVCVMAHESRWMSTRTPTSVCGGCVGSEATSE